MIGYTTIGANDLDKAVSFYDTLLAELGGAPTDAQATAIKRLSEGLLAR